MIAAMLAVLAVTPAAADPANPACQAVRQEVAHYFAEEGACPCPYHVARDGHACGGRSAWAKRQGSSPRCFIDDNAARLAPGGASLMTGARWPDPPSCSLESTATPARSDGTRTAALPSSE